LSEAEEPAAAFIIKQIFCRYTKRRAALTHLIDFILIIFLPALPMNRY